MRLVFVCMCVHVTIMKLVRDHSSMYASCARIWENVHVYGRMCTYMGECARIWENVHALHVLINPYTPLQMHFVRVCVRTCVYTSHLCVTVLRSNQLL